MNEELSFSKINSPTKDYDFELSDWSSANKSFQSTITTNIT